MSDAVPSTDAAPPTVPPAGAGPPTAHRSARSMTGELHRSALDERRIAEQRQAVVVAAVLSAGLHYPLLHTALMLAAGGGRADAAALDAFDVTEVSLLDGLDLSADLTEAERKAAQERLDRDRPETPPEDRLDGQVVALPPQADTRPPLVDTRYLAREDSRVEKETKRHGDPNAAGPRPPGDARPAAAATDRARPAPSADRDSPTPDAPVAAGRRPAEVPTEALAMLEPAEARPDRRDSPGRPDRQERRLSLLPPGEGELKVAPELLMQPDPTGGRAPGPHYEALLPPLSGGLRPDGGGGGGDRGTDDYLPDVDEGDETALNARRFKYWSFFQRVKESIQRNWRPVEEYHRADPTGRVYGVRDRMTVLAVTLDRQGGLLDLSLREGSGMAPLDDEAIRAFRAAQPFPNPPPGLIGGDGTIAFTFALYLDIQHGLEFHPMRMPALR